jgi:hypothetical protein
MFVDDSFIEDLPDNPQLAGLKICDHFATFDHELFRSGNQGAH